MTKKELINLIKPLKWRKISEHNYVADCGFFILELEMDKYKQYEEAKKQLQKLNLDAKQYETLIKQLANKLEI